MFATVSSDGTVEARAIGSNQLALVQHIEAIQRNTSSHGNITGRQVSRAMRSVGRRRLHF